MARWQWVRFVCCRPFRLEVLPAGRKGLVSGTLDAQDNKMDATWGNMRISHACCAVVFSLSTLLCFARGDGEIYDPKGESVEAGFVAAY